MVSTLTLIATLFQQSTTTVGLLAIESFPSTEAGFEDLLGWLVGFGSVTRVGVEGTGSWRVGLSRFLHDREVMVVEVDMPNRQTRRRVGKSDPQPWLTSSTEMTVYSAQLH